MNMKKTSVHIKEYIFGMPVIGSEVVLTGSWKVVIINGNCHLEFAGRFGRWYHEDDLIIIEREEFINECM